MNRIKTKILIALMMLGSVGTAGQNVHPRYLEIPVPSGGTEVGQNPPILRWPHEKGKNIVYEVMLSRDPLFEDNRNMMKAKTTMAVFNPHRKLNPGIWYWKYRKNGGNFSKPQKFVVRSDAVNLASPPAEEFLKSVPADHPRILLQKNEAERFRTFQDDPDARAIITQAKKYLTAPVPSEKDAWSGKKMDDPGQQRKLDLDASQDASSTVYEKIITLAQAFILTGNQDFSAKAISMGMEVSSWDPEGVTRLSDFGDARCMLGMALVFDTFYDQLDERQKEKLVRASSARAANFYKSWINDIETKVLSGHVWQHILHYFFQTALALHGEEPLAEQWLTYAYELFLARAPVLGGPDGGWVEGVSYFRMNMETMIDIPLFIRKFTGFDFIGSHPWYRGNTKWMIYHIPPGSAADGFGDNTEEVFSPGAAYLAYAQEIAKLNKDTLAAWYTREVRKYETPDLSATEVLRWVRLTKTRGLKIPEVKNDPALPMAVVFRETGLAAIHSDPLSTPDNLMVAFKSSPFGSYGHMLCDQNTFNILYGGKKLFYRTGYKVTMDDPHRTGWYQTTKSQNGILINDQGQTYSNNAFGWISRFMQGEEIAYIKGDATNAYNNEETGKPEVKKVIRHLVLIKPDLIIIYDELESEKDVRWGWLIHSFQKMKTDPANSTFSVTLPGVKGSGKIFSSQEVRWTVTDTFEVPAVNWRKSRYPDGRLKTYDDQQWHLKVTGQHESKAIRYLTILQISPTADLNQILTENKPGKNRNVDLAIGQWSVSANLNTDVPPGLVIRKKDGRVAFSIDSKEINLKGEIFNGNQENSSLLIEKKNGQPFIQEAGDSIPEAMRNVLLYH
jgi:hypothetical protein